MEHNNSKWGIILITVLLAALFAVAAYKNAKRAGLPAEDRGGKVEKVIIHGTADPTGGFTVSYSPSFLTFNTGYSGQKNVTIIIVPEAESFAEPVFVRVMDILKDGESIIHQENAPVRAQFASPTVEKQNYAKGVSLTISVSKSAMGEYTIVAAAMVGGVRKPVIISLVVGK